MDEKKRQEQKWADLEAYIEGELKKTRQRARMADSFDEMEEMVAEVGQRLQRAILAAAVEQRQPGGRMVCGECGAWMENKGLTARKLKTSLGAVEMERERWACPACGASLFPPGSATQA
jgi:ribosomal protein S27AE